MKTLQELYDEVISSEDLKKEFLSANASESDAKAFLEKHGCDSSLEELKAFLKERFEAESGKMKELEDEDLDEVAGGSKVNTVFASVLTVAVACFVAATNSYFDDSRATVGECMDI